MDQIDVLYMCDDSFAPIAGVSMTSLFENNPSDKIAVTVYLMVINVSEENWKRFSLLAQKYHQTIHIIDAAAAYEDLCKTDIPTYRGSAMTNLRLYFDRYVPKTVSRLLYLDCDTLICGSLTMLSLFNMDGKLLGMVKDAYGSLLKRTRGDTASYYNAGVLLIDCNRWRSELWTAKIQEYISQNCVHLTHPDQDIYNIVCKKEIISLPICCNFQTVHRMYSDQVYFHCMPSTNYYPVDEIAVARRSPLILHMIRTLGGNPWNCGCIHPDRMIFLHYKEISLWKNVPEFPIKNDPIISIEKVLYKVLPPQFFFPISLWAIRIIQTIDKNNTY